jgi:hypothetical protein
MRGTTGLVNQLESGEARRVLVAESRDGTACKRRCVRVVQRDGGICEALVYRYEMVRGDHIERCEFYSRCL